MICLLMLLSTAAAMSISPTLALKNAHQYSMNAFSQHLEGSPYESFILSSYAEPLLKRLDDSWTLAYIENDASLFLQDFSDLIRTESDKLMVKMSSRYEECIAPNSFKSLEKRVRWGIPIKIEESNTDQVPANAANTDQVPANVEIQPELLSEVAASEQKSVNVAKQTDEITIKGKFNDLIRSIKDFFSVLVRNTGCTRVVSVLGYVLIGSVLLAYLATFVLFGVKYAKYLLNASSE